MDESFPHDDAEPIEDVMKAILVGSDLPRIDVVVHALKKEEVKRSGDLKYLDWTALESMKFLTDMEIKKIMRHVQTNYPDEYKEYKKKRDNEFELKRKTDLLNYKIEKEQELQRDMENYRRQTKQSMATFGQNYGTQESNFTPIVQQPNQNPSRGTNGELIRQSTRRWDQSENNRMQLSDSGSPVQQSNGIHSSNRENRENSVLERSLYCCCAWCCAWCDRCLRLIKAN